MKKLCLFIVVSLLMSLVLTVSSPFAGAEETGQAAELRLEPAAGAEPVAEESPDTAAIDEIERLDAAEFTLSDSDIMAWDVGPSGQHYHLTLAPDTDERFAEFIARHTDKPVQLYLNNSIFYIADIHGMLDGNSGFVLKVGANQQTEMALLLGPAKKRPDTKNQNAAQAGMTAKDNAIIAAPE